MSDKTHSWPTEVTTGLEQLHGRAAAYTLSICPGCDLAHIKLLATST